MLKLIAGAPSYSDSRQESPPGVQNSPEIAASKITLPILSDTLGGLQGQNYIFLMNGELLTVASLTISLIPAKSHVNN
jgi:hypothetical protein